MTELPKWPDSAYWIANVRPDLEATYQEARAEAALARLRVAVEALEMYVGDRDQSAKEALAAIGPLPTDAGEG